MDSEGSDQPVHLCSLIMAFVRKQNHWILKSVLMQRKCPDETGHMQDDVNPHILRMFKGTFSLDVVHLYMYSKSRYRISTSDAQRGKGCLCHIQTVKTQNSLHICTVLSSVHFDHNLCCVHTKQIHFSLFIT